MNHACGQALNVCDLMDGLQTGVVVLDAEHRVTLWNNWMERYSGCSRAQATGKTLSEIFAETETGRLHQAIDYAVRNNLPSIISPALHHPPLALFAKPEDRAQNMRIQQLIHVTPLAGNCNSGRCLLQVDDMTAAVAKEKILRQQATDLRRSSNIDALTGIANRRMLNNTLEDEFRRAQRMGSSIALIMLDVDLFKEYNDHYGHPMGDACLVRIAEVLRDSQRRVGDLAARYGGEEFTLVLLGVDEGVASALAEKLRLAIATLDIPHAASSVAPHVTISAGVALMTPDGESSPLALISAADQALYRAKQQGRNRSYFYSITDGSFQPCA